VATALVAGAALGVAGWETARRGTEVEAYDPYA
jgi:hypothetical protein